MYLDVEPQIRTSPADQLKFRVSSGPDLIVFLNLPLTQ